ncbi:SCO2521 family protein [Streptomyces sp. NBC_01373]|uniref:SCO2521 family protein n=1 Tax=unclassified Streptomyces TaxID=2593676 RepID=UPI0022572F25|nr:SCO2521 family protein [Streptomyces sp. NBC_01373]MCX4702815.1 SCO2521 family protein [Streptomyces sp. NBC_01373]
MTDGRDDGEFAMVGEVRTGLLMNRLALPSDQVAELLDLVPGERVRARERPVPWAVSADQLHGVDCPLITRSGARPRAIGTLAARVRVVGGRVVQGSTRSVVAPGGDRRQRWSHYMARPGVVELGGRGDPADAAARFLTGRAPESLDPGAVSEALLRRIRASRLLDRRSPFRPRRTRLRWSAVVGGERLRGAFTLVDAELRTVRLRVPEAAGVTREQLTALCEDLALHDWLLTTVARVVERRASDADPAAQDDLLAVVGQLLHLWLPSADVPPRLGGMWEGIEVNPGFTRQWELCVNRLRDELTLRALRGGTVPQ